MSCEPAIRVEQVSKRYELFARPADQLRQLVMPPLRRWAGLPPRAYAQEFWALRDVSLEVARGEPFGIVGRNGSGKSTLLQVITGVLEPTSGTVATEGRVAALLELGCGFNPEFSGRENVFLNGAVLGFTRAQVEARFDAIAAFADIGPHLDQALKTYSSGMMVRLAAAVQMQLQPDILIIDEALAVGDALFQKRCHRRIRQLLDDGCALLFVSHEQELVRSLTRRALFLDQGRVRASGASADVVFAYREFLHRQEEQAFLQAAQERGAAAIAAEADRRSFGNLAAQVLGVQVLDGQGRPAEVLESGDAIAIRIQCVAHAPLSNLNVAFRLRTKEGVKVTTWGTLNEDMALFDAAPEATFWSRSFQAGEAFTVTFSGVCRLAANFYEVEAVVAREYDRYYRNQRILHWVDAATHFSVVLRERRYVFDGVVDLGLRSHAQPALQGRSGAIA